MNDEEIIATVNRLEARIETPKAENQRLREENAELRDQIGTELFRHLGGADE